MLERREMTLKHRIRMAQEWSPPTRSPPPSPPSPRNRTLIARSASLRSTTCSTSCPTPGPSESQTRISSHWPSPSPRSSRNDCTTYPSSSRNTPPSASARFTWRIKLLLRRQAHACGGFISWRGLHPHSPVRKVAFVQIHASRCTSISIGGWRRQGCWDAGDHAPHRVYYAWVRLRTGDVRQPRTARLVLALPQVPDGKYTRHRLGAVAKRYGECES